MIGAQEEMASITYISLHMMGKKPMVGLFFVLWVSTRHGLLSSPRQGAYAAEKVFMQVSARPTTIIRKAEVCERPLCSTYASSGVLDNATPRSKISLYYGCFLLLLLHLTKELSFHRLQACCTT